MYFNYMRYLSDYTSQSNGQLTNTDVCMYPNPAKGDVYLSFELENKQELEVELRSLQGEENNVSECSTWFRSKYF